MKKKIAIITIHNTSGCDLMRTLTSIDGQILKPDLSLVVAKQINNFHIQKFKKNYRKFIVGKDNSLWNAMNIGIKQTKKYFILFLNSGDKFYNKNAILNIKKSINIKPVTHIFKTQLIFKQTIFNPTKSYFLKKNYSPHPSFVRSPVNSNKMNLFNEKNLINADGEWMKKERNKKVFKKIDKIISTYYLGGQSSNPSFKSIKKLFIDNYISGFKELIKFLIFNILKRDHYYKLIYFFKYDSKNKK